MRRRTPVHAAAVSAFARSLGRQPAAIDNESRLQPAALAFVVGFPGLVGAVALLAALSRSGVDDGAFPMAVALLAVAGVFLALGLRSVAVVGRDGLTNE